MRKSSLSTAVVAGIAGVSSIDHCATAIDQLDRVLIYPYYTPSGGYVQAHDGRKPRSKVVKVRFLEGYNSREVHDFNLHLSPNDVWAAKEG